MNASIFSSHVHLSVLGSCRLGTGDGSDFAAAPTVAEKTHIISSSPCRTPCALSVTSFRSAVWLCLLCSGVFFSPLETLFFLPSTSHLPNLRRSSHKSSATHSVGVWSIVMHPDNGVAARVWEFEHAHRF